MQDRDFVGAFGFLDLDDGVLLVANDRLIDGLETLVWDLPGGGVERGETLEDALRREMREETGLEVGVGELLAVAEGERIRAGLRTAVWRSFFFRVERLSGSMRAGAEIQGLRIEPRETMPALLTAPYHRGFVTWLASGGDRPYVFDRWAD